METPAASLSQETRQQAAETTSSPEKRGKRTIIVAVDGSPGSKQALQFVCSNILQPSDDLLLIHVRPEFSEDWLYSEGSDERLVKESRQLLQQMKEVVHQSQCQVQEVKCESWSGDARNCLVRLADSLHPQLLAMGSRGRGLIARTLLGSVSDYVVRYAACPVLIVRMKEVENKTPTDSSTSSSSSFTEQMKNLGVVVDSGR
eukprot:TRINITY_DN2454_c0_g1_i2.p1 TRINITY_DN2454_c0_g1~~TRINITY_DN2454_c0_g1_i2.p1  ORF type:complete len:202 (+),score=60.52 TRINITY_DN2454_c0_g1_i2:67-672(+)